MVLYLLGRPLAVSSHSIPPTRAIVAILLVRSCHSHYTLDIYRLVRLSVTTCLGFMLSFADGSRLGKWDVANASPLGGDTWTSLSTSQSLQSRFYLRQAREGRNDIMTFDYT